MTRAASHLAAVTLVALATQACTHRAGDFTLATTQKIDITQLSLDARSGKRVEGEHCVMWLLGIIPTGQPNLEAAIDHALGKSGMSVPVLVEQVTRYKVTTFILFNEICLTVEGIAVSAVRKPAPAQILPSAPDQSPTAALEAPVNPTASAARFERGAMARALTGARLRTRAMLEADSLVSLAPGAVLTLAATISNASGKWWYAESAGSKGWIPESELEPALAPDGVSGNSPNPAE